MGKMNLSRFSFLWASKLAFPKKKEGVSKPWCERPQSLGSSKLWRAWLWWSGSYFGTTFSRICGGISQNHPHEWRLHQVVSTRAYVVLLTLAVSYITSVFTLAYETNNLRRHTLYPWIEWSVFGGYKPPEDVKLRPPSKARQAQLHQERSLHDMTFTHVDDNGTPLRSVAATVVFSCSC